MPSIRNIAKPPYVPYFVTKYPETWETLSVPESWLTVTTSQIDLTADELREERSYEYHRQVEDYKRESRVWARIQQDRADAKAAKATAAAAAAAIIQARMNSPEYKAKRDAINARRKALITEMGAENKRWNAIAVAAEAARPKTAREQRAIARNNVRARDALKASE